MAPRILREPAVKDRTGLSRTQRWRLEKQGEFPKRRRLGPNAMGWIESEVDAWIEARVRGGADSPRCNRAD